MSDDIKRANDIIRRLDAGSQVVSLPAVRDVLKALTARVKELEEVAKISHSIIGKIMDPGHQFGDDTTVERPYILAGELRSYRRKISDVAVAKRKRKSGN